MSMSKSAVVEVESTQLGVSWVPRVGEKVEVRAGPEQLRESLLIHATERSDNTLMEVAANGSCQDLAPHDWFEFDQTKSLALVERDSKGKVKCFQRVEFVKNFSSKTKKKRQINQIIFRYPTDDHEANVKLRKKVFGKYLKGEVKAIDHRDGRPVFRVKITTTMTELAAKHRAIANDSFNFELSAIRPHLALKRLDQKGGKKNRTTLVGDHDTRLVFIPMMELDLIADLLGLQECGQREMDIILRYPIEVILRSRRWDRELRNVRASYDEYLNTSEHEREQVSDYLKFTCKMELRQQRMRVTIEKRDPRILWAFRVFIELLTVTALVQANQERRDTLVPLRDDWEALCDINTRRCHRTLERRINQHDASRQELREQQRIREHQSREREERARSRAVHGTAKWLPQFAIEERHSRFQPQITRQATSERRSPRMTTARMTVTDHRGEEPRRREDIVLRVPFPNRFPTRGPTPDMYYEYARVSPHYHQHQFAGQMCRILNPRPGVCYDVVICSGVRSSKCIKFSARDIACNTLLPLDRCREEMMLDNLAQVQADLKKVTQGILHPCQFTFNQRGNWEALCSLGDDLKWMTNGTRLVKFVGMTVSIRVHRAVRVTRYADLDDGLKFELTRACRELVENGFSGKLHQTTALGIKVLGGSVRRDRETPGLYTFKGTVRVNVQENVAANQWPPYQECGKKFSYQDPVTDRTYYTTLMVFDAERIGKFRDYNKMARDYEAPTAKLPASYRQRCENENFLTFLDAIKGYEEEQAMQRQSTHLAVPASDHRRSASNSPTPGRLSPSGGSSEMAAPVDDGRKGPLYNLGQQVSQQTPTGQLLVGEIAQVFPAQSHAIILPSGEWGYTVRVHTGTNHTLYMCDQDIIDHRTLGPLDPRQGTMRVVPGLLHFNMPCVRESQIQPFVAPIQTQMYHEGVEQDIMPPILETPARVRASVRHATASDQSSSDEDETPALALAIKGGFGSIASDQDSDESNQDCAPDSFADIGGQSHFPAVTGHDKYAPELGSRDMAINTFVDG